MTIDERTLAAYRKHADQYAERFSKPKPDRNLSAFIKALPNTPRVLDLGCGPGSAAALMMQAGIEVDAMDASPEMAELALKRYGLNVRIAGFDGLDAVNIYDGVWANFSLLHTPRPEMPAHLQAIRRALKPTGILHLGMKLGEGEKRDKLGRFYCYYTQDELSDLLKDAGLSTASIRTFVTAGLDGTNSDGIVIQACSPM